MIIATRPTIELTNMIRAYRKALYAIFRSTTAHPARLREMAHEAYMHRPRKPGKQRVLKLTAREKKLIGLLENMDSFFVELSADEHETYKEFRRKVQQSNGRGSR